MRRNLIIAGLVAALGVAALVDALRGGSPAAQTPVSGVKQAALTGPGDTLRGPDVPAPGGLPGVLVYASPEDCRLREIDFAAATIGDPGAETTCRVWVSPSGGQGVVETGNGTSPGARVISLVRLQDPPEVERRLGEARGNVAWSADGAQLAWCRPDGVTVVHRLGDGSERTVAGCDPHFAPDGGVLTLPDGPLVGQLLREGQVLLDTTEIARGFGPSSSGPIDVLEFDVARDGLVALSAARLTPNGERTVLELWRGNALQANTELPAQPGNGLARLGQLLRFGPDGREIAIGATYSAGEIGVVDVGLRRLLLRASVRTFAWSPDGAWLALAVGDEIRIYGQLLDTPIYVLPVTASALGWSGQERPAE